MEKKKIPSKRLVLIAFVLGVIFLIGGFFVSFNNPRGNTSEKIQQVEDAIGTISITVLRKLYPQYNDMNDVELATKTHAKYYPEKDFNDFARHFFNKIAKEEFTWEGIDKITSPLVYENERIAKAKALLRFNENPIPSYSFDNNLWTERFDISKQDWKIQSFSSRIVTSAGKGFVLFFVSIIISYLILTVIPWIWYFLLDRISELSQAIRGR
jgi:hypothetical protein